MIHNISKYFTSLSPSSPAESDATKILNDCIEKCINLEYEGQSINQNISDAASISTILKFRFFFFCKNAKGMIMEIDKQQQISQKEALSRMNEEKMCFLLDMIEDDIDEWQLYQSAFQNYFSVEQVVVSTYHQLLIQDLRLIVNNFNSNPSLSLSKDFFDLAQRIKRFNEIFVAKYQR